MNFRLRTREEPEINLIPFIDVLLVVLIFLMLTTTYSRFSELQLQLPVANADPPPERAGDLVVSVASDGRYAVDAQVLSERSVEALAAALSTATGGRTDAMLVISADATAAHQSVVTVLEAARRAGIVRLTFAALTTAPAAP